MKFRNIKRFPNINYRVNVGIEYIPDKIKGWCERGLGCDLQLNPDFQRGNVWTEKQQIAYIEYLLKNPTTGKEIYFNHPNWMGNWKGDFVLVDGLQRLITLLKFMNNEIPAYSILYKDYEGKIPSDINLVFNVATLKTRKEVLQWYLDFNIGGTIHSKEEIKKVKLLLKNEEE